MERFYYKDEKGNLFNFKSANFIKYKEVEEKFYLNDENGNPILDENNEQKYNINKKLVEDGLLDGYTQITKEEFEELAKPKVYELTPEQKVAQEKARQINACKKYLQDTDYIVLKIAECMSEGRDTTALRTEYAEQLKLRQECRDKINKLEAN